MTDPSDALKSFQQTLLRGEIKLLHGDIDPELFVYLDRPNGIDRFTYARLEHQTVTALAMLVLVDPIEGALCFNIGYAVPDAYRNQGRAKDIVDAAISEMGHGLARAKISTFYVEAIIGADNRVSQRVAAKTISAMPVAVTDEVSRLPAFQYLRKIESA
jgi:RimJ/RimL family protein N-acetyltransferase